MLLPGLTFKKIIFSEAKNNEKNKTLDIPVEMSFSNKRENIYIFHSTLIIAMTFTNIAVTVDS